MIYISSIFYENTMQNLGKYNLFYHKIEILFIDLLYDIQTIKRTLTQND